MKSRFICIVSSPNLWEDHHHLILSLRPVMGIQRAGYHTAQSAGKGCGRRWHIWTEAPQPGVSDGSWPPSKLLQTAGAPLHPQHCSSPHHPPSFFFFTRIRFSLLHSIALLCHFLQLLSFPWNMALRQLIRVLHCVISSNFY